MLLGYTTAKTSELLFTRLLSSHFSGAAVSATLVIAQHKLCRYIYSACFILFFIIIIIKLSASIDFQNLNFFSALHHKRPPKIQEGENTFFYYE
jgi:thiosulfate reductase cytochrome b subunit